jgi:phage terminase large subunit
MLKASDTGLIPESELALAKRDLSEEQYAQEFECSFDAAVVGAYYGKLMARAEAERRITDVPYEPAAAVWTSWDLGIRDATAIWFAQVVGRQIRVIDYYEASGVDLGHYVREIGARPYVYAGHIVPHDAQAKELGTGKSRLEVLESLGLKNLQLAPMHRLEDGINAVRVFLPKCWFDAEKCARGIDALKLYRAEYDDKLQALRPRAVHDWTSHAADAFRYLALTLDRKAAPAGFYRRIEYPQHGVV